VRIVRLLVTTGALVAVVLTLLSGDPQGPRLLGDEGDDAVSSLDLSDALPATPIVPLVVPPRSGSVFVDHRPPPSRLTTAEVFRPPRRTFG
jgi:hypothetical protein